MSNLDYGVIGNCQIIALVNSKNASIDWACFPRFDSPSVFARLLDEDKGGHFAIYPENPDYTSKQYYLTNTNILITEFTCPGEGSFCVVDFIPRFRQYERYFKPCSIYRKIIRLSGAPRVIIDCEPKLNYAKDVTISKLGSNHINYGDDLRLSTNASLTYIMDKTPFKIEKDVYFAMTWGIPLEAPIKDTFESFFDRTREYWIDWVKKTRVPSIYQEEVIRASLSLKLCCFSDTGAIIAAPTTSIPESKGSVRNWDYRYCWFRDAYFTMKSLEDLGHYTEKEKFVSYLSNIIFSERNKEYMQPLYSISGETQLTEITLDYLKGFKGHQPIRVGNDAYTHQQYDLYGEMVMCLAPIFFDKRLISYDLEKLFIDFKDLVEKSINFFLKPDAGIWEFRSTGGIHTFTQIFCWAAAHKGASVAREMKHFDLAKEWAKKADEMQEIILRDAWNEELGIFTQRFGGDNPDASNLLMASIGIIDAKDPKFISMVQQYGKMLRKDDYIYRYINEDDFGFPEVSFTICTFWYIDALIDIGEIDEAKRLYENLLDRRNHVGLLSEDIDPATNELWGNYPQTYSQVGVINTAMKLEKALGKDRYCA
jgi:GH15 family glucan-1,4-alpha-glucosidase